MKEEHRDLLRKRRRDFVDIIVNSRSLEALLSELGYKDQKEDYGLTPLDIINIRGGRETNAAKQADTFLDILFTRGENAFERFKQALININQVGLIEILNSELPPSQQIKTQRTASAATGSLSSAASNNSIHGLQKSLREMYLDIFHYVEPISVSFSFDIENNWIPLAFKLDGESSSTEDHIDLLNKVFSKKKMLILEGDPGIGKTSLLRRIAYKWAHNDPRLTNYDIVLYSEFRELKEEKFKNIIDIVKKYMASHLYEHAYKKFDAFIMDINIWEDLQILVLLDGYDESSLKEQCEQLSNYLYSITPSRRLLFNVLITSRKGYLSELRKQKGRYSFADIFGFTTASQKEDYIMKYFTAENGTQSTEIIKKVNDLLRNNENLQQLATTPLLLSFICVVYHKMKDGSELELYMNIIWWLLDRHQRAFPDHDVPGLLGLEYNNNEDKLSVIENNYRYFPQLHLLGKMGMEDIFKSTFTDKDLEKFQINPIIQQVGLLRNEKMRDDSFHKKTEYTFPHRTIQEFLTAFAFFYSTEEPYASFKFYFLYPWKRIARGIVQEKLQSFMIMINSSSLNIVSSRKNIYSEIIEHSKYVDKTFNPIANRTNTKDYHECESLNNAVIGHIPKSSEEAIAFLKKEANQGNAEAFYSLGMIYNYGLLMEKNDEEAVVWYTKAAEHGFASAQCNLGWLFENGWGTVKSYKEAVKWYLKAAEQGFDRAQHNLALCYEKGQGVDQSYEEAVVWYTKAAEHGFASAQCNLGWLFENGWGAVKSYEDAVKWYLKAADQGFDKAQHNLALCYEKGHGVDQSYEEAVVWYTKAAEQGFASAQCNLGRLFENGWGTVKSYEEAVKWYLKAAEQGLDQAQINLAFCYEKGQGIFQSSEEAVVWYTKAAEQGFASAQFNLALCYDKGQGVDQSYEEAVLWYTKAAEQGDPDAQCNLGVMYQNGWGVDKSYEEAVKLYKKSAEQGNAYGQCNLGEVYERGQGVPQSYREAEQWYEKAAEQKVPYGQNNLKILYDKMQGIVPQSDEEAFDLYRKSAEQENSDAQYKLGHIYQQARGVPQSYEEAVKWYRKAAEQGNADGQYNLAYMYQNGEYVPQSDEKAEKWYKKAAEQGHTKAQFVLQDNKWSKSIIELRISETEECDTKTAEMT